jgi:hypothetical protein
MNPHRTTALAVLLALAGLSACRAGSVDEPAPAIQDTGPSGQPSPPAASEVLPSDWQDLAPGLTEGFLADLGDLGGATEYVIDLHLAADLQRVEAHQTVHYTNREDVALGELYFRLYPVLVGGEMTVTAVQVDGEVVEPGYEYERSALRVPLRSPLQPAEAIDVAIDYTVDVPGPSEGLYGVLAYSEGILSLAHAYPMIPVYDDEGWNLEVPPPHGDVVYADASFFRVTVTAPQAVVLAAAGMEVEHSSEGGTQQVTYVAGPARDFYLAASERFEVIERQVSGTTLRSYAPPEFREASERALTFAGQALEVFGEAFGPYTYTELDLVAADFAALGVEYPGILMLELGFYDPADDSRPPDWFESVVVHEVGHLWFYSAVGNDQLDEPWLDESLVQYITMMYSGDMYGQQGYDGYHQALEARWERVDRAEIPIGMPARAYNGTEYSAIVYGRGAFFFEALKEHMGEARFDDFLRDYFQANLWGIGTTESLRDLAEQHCGCDLSTLFEDWVYAP